MFGGLLLLLACATEAPAPRADAADPAAAAPAEHPVAAAPLTFVGSDRCAECHADASAAWTGSHHQLALVDLSGDGGAASPPPGLEAALETFGVQVDLAPGFALGVHPLRQWLQPGEGGRWQVLPVAWDSRPASDGGQRWFAPHPDALDADGGVHWQDHATSFTLQCAECHTTGLVKGYDAATDSYATRWAEAGVGCESCHGPGSRHVADPAAADTIVTYAHAGPAGWSTPTAEQPIATRVGPETPAASQVCAPCHSRRSALLEQARITPGGELSDSHRLALPAPPLYFADGQQLEEVFEWGSFQQSAMAAAGVGCLDCHDAHGLGLRAQGDALCSRCHAPAAFAATSHHGHPTDSDAARCVACHMPARTYMGVDARVDHRLAVPRPDLAASLGLPEPCTGCHEDRDAAWAAASLDQLHGPGWRDRPSHATLFHRAGTDPGSALPELLALAADPQRPDVLRATAVQLAAPAVGLDAASALSALSQDASPLVRVAALEALAPFPDAIRDDLGRPRLADPVRGVRIEAATLLADLPASSNSDALRELEAMLETNADWPAFAVQRAMLRMAQGRPVEAEAELRRALRLSPGYPVAAGNLADLLRSLGRDGEGGPLLREALAITPEQPHLHHALGLWLVRQGHVADALPHLDTAARLAPEAPHYVFVLAVALDDQGRRAEALRHLAEARARHPADPELARLAQAWGAP